MNDIFFKKKRPRPFRKEGQWLALKERLKLAAALPPELPLTAEADVS